MNYWQRWIGAWKKKTGGKSLIERGAYSEMLDAYYANETAITANEDELFRLVGAMTKQEQDAVRAVKANPEFFTERDGKLYNARAEEELKRRAVFCELQRARRLGTTSQPKAQAPKYKSNSNRDPAAFEQFWFLYPRKVAHAAAEKAWLKIPPAEHHTIMAVLAAQVLTWRDPKFIPHAATWLNGKRWQDEASKSVTEQAREMIFGKEKTVEQDPERISDETK